MHRLAERAEVRLLCDAARDVAEPTIGERGDATEGSVEERVGEDGDVLRVATALLELRARGRDERAAVDGSFDERGIRLEQALDAPLFGEIRLRAKERRPARAREAGNAEHANAMEHATALRAFWIG